MKTFQSGEGVCGGEKREEDAKQRGVNAGYLTEERGNGAPCKPLRGSLNDPIARQKKEQGSCGLKNPLKAEGSARSAECRFEKVGGSKAQGVGVRGGGGVTA